MNVSERVSVFVIELHHRNTPLQDALEELLVENRQALMHLNQLVRIDVIHFKNKR